MQEKNISRLCVAMVLAAMLTTACAHWQTAASPAALSAWRDCPNCPELMVVPAGEFMMGSPDVETQRERAPDMMARREKPMHRVHIPHAFALGRYPVTLAEFGAFVADTGYDPQGCYINMNGTPGVVNTRNWRNPGFAQSQRDPVVCISHPDALRYVQWLSATTGKTYRLPSEAEWEYAARAGTSTARYWSDAQDDICRHANAADRSTPAHELVVPASMGGNEALSADCNDGYPYTAPVGSFTPNAFGLYDMLGNAWQLTADCWNESQLDAPTDGAARVSGNCAQHVIRGGAWNSAPSALRAATRHVRPDTIRGYSTGLRVLRELP